MSVTVALPGDRSMSIHLGWPKRAALAAAGAWLLTSLARSLLPIAAIAARTSRTIGVSATVQATCLNTASALTVCGQVVAGQFVAPGAYGDTVTATVTY